MPTVWDTGVGEIDNPSLLGSLQIGTALDATFHQ